MDGGDAFFADELILRRSRAKTKFKSADTQTGNYNQSWLSTALRQPHVAHRRPTRRPHPTAAPGAAESARAKAAARKGADLPHPAGFVARARAASTHGTPNLRAGYQSYYEIMQGPDAWPSAPR